MRIKSEPDPGDPRDEVWNTSFITIALAATILVLLRKGLIEQI